MPALGASGRRRASVATRTGANMPRYTIESENVLPNRHFGGPGHGWKATGLPTNNTYMYIM